MIAVAVTLRFALFGCSGVAAHKGAYGALFKVRCMVAEHMARAPLGALNERRTGDIKTVLNEDIEKLELFLAHNLPDLVCYLVGPVVIFIYLMTVNIPLALISLVPLILAVVVMGMMFRNTDDLMERANHSITTLNSVMIEYISGMKLIKAYAVALWIVFCKYRSHRIKSPYRSINHLLQKSEAFQSVHHVTFILCYTVL